MKFMMSFLFILTFFLSFQELAIRNVFHITSYCPTLRDDILELVIHQMLTIDVRKQNNIQSILTHHAFFLPIQTTN